MADATTPRCTDIAPQALTGHLGRLQCTLPSFHQGNHRSHKTITGVGKIIVKWRGQSHQPPVIELPPARIDQPQGRRP